MPVVRSCREAQASCEFAGAFWLAAQCAQALESVGALRVAEELGQSASRLYAGTIQHLEAALAAVCADFRADQYARVWRSGLCTPPVYACSCARCNFVASARCSFMGRGCTMHCCLPETMTLAWQGATCGRGEPRGLGGHQAYAQVADEE